MPESVPLSSVFAVRMALSPNAGLKYKSLNLLPMLEDCQNGAKPECKGRN